MAAEELGGVSSVVGVGSGDSSVDVGAEVVVVSEVVVSVASEPVGDAGSVDSVVVADVWVASVVVLAVVLGAAVVVASAPPPPTAAPVTADPAPLLLRSPA